MANEVEILQQRIAKARAALREAKRREKEKESRRVFELVKRSGLSLADVEKLLTSAGKNTGGGEQ